MPCGDFNARSRSLRFRKDTTDPYTSEKIEKVKSVTPDIISNLKRKRLMACSNAHLVVSLNGLKDYGKDFDSDFTCVIPNGRSVVDYFIVGQNILKFRRTFFLSEHVQRPFDQVPIFVEFEFEGQESAKKPTKRAKSNVVRVEKKRKSAKLQFQAT